MKPSLQIPRNTDVTGSKVIEGESCLRIPPSKKRAVNLQAHISRMSCLLAMGAILTGNCDATTVVVVRQDDFILIGVDSRVATMNPVSGAGELRACKIMQHGPYFFVLTGIFGQGGPEGFNAYKAVEDIAKDTNGAFNIADKFTRVARLPYAEMLESFQQRQPLVFDKYCEGRECLQLLVADFNFGNPVYAVRRFQVVLKHNRPTVGSLPNRDCPGTCPLPASIVILGDNIEAMKVLNETPNFWQNHTLITGVEDLIKTEAIAHPDEVGGQVSILVIDRGGAHWAPGHQGECGTVQPYTTEKGEK